MTEAKLSEAGQPWSDEERRIPRPVQPTGSIGAEDPNPRSPGSRTPTAEEAVAYREHMLEQERLARICEPDLPTGREEWYRQTVMDEELSQRIARELANRHSSPSRRMTSNPTLGGNSYEPTPRTHDSDDPYVPASGTRRRDETTGVQRDSRREPTREHAAADRMDASHPADYDPTAVNDSGPGLGRDPSRTGEDHADRAPTGGEKACINGARTWGSPPQGGGVGPSSAIEGQDGRAGSFG